MNGWTMRAGGRGAASACPRRTLGVLLLCAGAACGVSAGAAESGLTVWHRTPAPLDARERAADPGATGGRHLPLPVGDRMIGALVFGGVEKERLQILDPSLGGATGRRAARAAARKDLAQAQALISGRREREAAGLALRRLTRQIDWMRSRQAAGDLWIETDPGGRVEEYRRRLDLSAGVATVSWRVGKTRHLRRVYPARGALWMHWTCEGPGAISATVRLTGREQPAATSGYHLILTGRHRPEPSDPAVGGKHFQTWVVADWNSRRPGPGGMTMTGNALRIRNVDEVQLCVSTAARDEEPEARTEALRGIATRHFPGTLQAHIADHQNRLEGLLPELKASPGDDVPTDERFDALRAGREDPALAALYLRYAQYLLAGIQPDAPPAEEP